jgi:hypothetical protein
MTPQPWVGWGQPTPPGPKPPAKPPNPAVRAIVIIVIVLLIAFCALIAVGSIYCSVNPDDCNTDSRSSSTSAPAEGPARESSTKRDPSAELACTHGRNVLHDAYQGLFSPEELRGKTKQVWEDAQYTENESIREDSRRMLAALNLDNGTAWLTASTDFLRSCEGAGL